MPPIDRLLAIMARLRDPEGGCPWDLEQDFASISPHTIEEAYEVDEAIASGDLEALRDELGDLLFQVVFQARIAEEQGAFDFAGVVAAIVDKLVRRHPHVFANAETPSSVESQRVNWEEIKAAERAAAGEIGAAPPDPFAGIPRSLPALARSSKLSGRLERLPDLAPDAEWKAEQRAEQRAEPIETLRCTLDLLAAKPAGPASDPERGKSDSDPTTALIGEGLRAWVELARGFGVDPEQALRQVDDARVAAVRARRAPTT